MVFTGSRDAGTAGTGGSARGDEHVACLSCLQPATGLPSVLYSKTHFKGAVAPLSSSYGPLRFRLIGGFGLVLGGLLLAVAHPASAAIANTGSNRHFSNSFAPSTLPSSASEILASPNTYVVSGGDRGETEGSIRKALLEQQLTNHLRAVEVARRSQQQELELSRRASPTAASTQPPGIAAATATAAALPRYQRWANAAEDKEEDSSASNGSYDDRNYRKPVAATPFSPAVAANVPGGATPSAVAPANTGSATDPRVQLQALQEAFEAHLEEQLAAARLEGARLERERLEKEYARLDRYRERSQEIRAGERHSVVPRERVERQIRGSHLVVQSPVDSRNGTSSSSRGSDSSSGLSSREEVGHPVMVLRDPHGPESSHTRSRTEVRQQERHSQQYPRPVEPMDRHPENRSSSTLQTEEEALEATRREKEEAMRERDMLLHQLQQLQRLQDEQHALQEQAEGDRKQREAEEQAARGRNNDEQQQQLLRQYHDQQQHRTEVQRMQRAGEQQRIVDNSERTQQTRQGALRVEALSQSSQTANSYSSSNSNSNTGTIEAVTGHVSRVRNSVQQQQQQQSSGRVEEGGRGEILHRHQGQQTERGGDLAEKIDSLMQSLQTALPQIRVRDRNGDRDSSLQKQETETASEILTDARENQRHLPHPRPAGSPSSSSNNSRINTSSSQHLPAALPSPPAQRTTMSSGGASAPAPAVVAHAGNAGVIPPSISGSPLQAGGYNLRNYRNSNLTVSVPLDSSNRQLVHREKKSKAATQDADADDAAERSRKEEWQDQSYKRAYETGEITVQENVDEAKAETGEAALPNRGSRNNMDSTEHTADEQHPALQQSDIKNLSSLPPLAASAANDAEEAYTNEVRLPTSIPSRAATLRKRETQKAVMAAGSTQEQQQHEPEEQQKEHQQPEDGGFFVQQGGTPSVQVRRLAATDKPEAEAAPQNVEEEEEKEDYNEEDDLYEFVWEAENQDDSLDWTQNAIKNMNGDIEAETQTPLVLNLQQRATLLQNAKQQQQQLKQKRLAAAAVAARDEAKAASNNSVTTAPNVGGEDGTAAAAPVDTAAAATPTSSDLAKISSRALPRSLAGLRKRRRYQQQDEGRRSSSSGSLEDDDPSLASTDEFPVVELSTSSSRPPPSGPQTPWIGAAWQSGSSSSSSAGQHGLEDGANYPNTPYRTYMYYPNPFSSPYSTHSYREDYGTVFNNLYYHDSSPKKVLSWKEYMRRKEEKKAQEKRLQEEENEPKVGVLQLRPAAGQQQIGIIDTNGRRSYQRSYTSPSQRSPYSSSSRSSSATASSSTSSASIGASTSRPSQTIRWAPSPSTLQSSSSSSESSSSSDRNNIGSSSNTTPQVASVGSSASPLQSSSSRSPQAVSWASSASPLQSSSSRPPQVVSWAPSASPLQSSRSRSGRTSVSFTPFSSTPTRRFLSDQKQQEQQ
ncbi:hypothetical protein, conserved [Eimeria maxima]|uniref:Uncharacterized protein n=1 Tax=Eimeria maxima TaxID=5804 RepID=U6M6W5_EIMMA|nr:hypothetical protein, conserved [Eimeria maxima]CDJ58803.1 hypothetical protein, conserved [Eimeria maxima]